MLDIIWDLFQQKQLHNHKAESVRRSRNNRDSIRYTENDIRNLTIQYERLRLVNMAMWNLLKDHTGMMESDLKKYITDLDKSDGKLDGKLARDKEMFECTKCKHSVFKSALLCPWCGTHNKRGGSAFHGT